MKIAVQLYGHMRTFRKCAPFLKKHILDHYDADVFIHTWDQTEHTSKTWYEENVKCQSEKVDDTLISLLNELYAPKDLKVDTQNLSEETGYYGTHNEVQMSLQAIKYMTYSQFMANQLRENYQKKHAITYDYVVVTRPDIMPFVKLDFANHAKEFLFYKDISIHYVLRLTQKVYDNRVFDLAKTSDLFYFSRPENVSKITSIYKEFDYYYKDITRIFPKQVASPEISFFENIYQKGIIPRQYINYFAIKRQNDADDIKLLPPGIEETAADSQFKKIAKRALIIIVASFPNIVIRGLINIFTMLGTCGHYLQVLQKNK